MKTKAEGLGRSRESGLPPIVQKVFDDSTFGEIVKSLRVCADMSQEDLAKKLDVTRQFVCGVEKDTKIVGVRFARRIADIFGMSVDVLVEKLLQEQLRRDGLDRKVKLFEGRAS
jgi:transcriptional regulator with XRE-family HTH domain